VSWLTATVYDLTLLGLERRCLSRWRSELLGPLRGDVLELGAGTGLNLEHYPASVNSITLIEPDAAMRRQLNGKLSKSALAARAQVGDSPAESLASKSASFDAVIATLVLCSVQNVELSLREARRVLRPGGTLALIEHIAAPEKTPRRRWQKLLEPAWSVVSGGCHLLRDPRRAIEEAGFEPVRVCECELRGAPGFIKPAFIGVYTA